MTPSRASWAQMGKLEVGLANAFAVLSYSISWDNFAISRDNYHACNCNFLHFSHGIISSRTKYILLEGGTTSLQEIIPDPGINTATKNYKHTPK